MRSVFKPMYRLFLKKLSTGSRKSPTYYSDNSLSFDSLPGKASPIRCLSASHFSERNSAPPAAMVKTLVCGRSILWPSRIRGPGDKTVHHSCLRLLRRGVSCCRCVFPSTSQNMEIRPLRASEYELAVLSDRTSRDGRSRKMTRTVQKKPRRSTMRTAGHQVRCLEE